MNSWPESRYTTAYQRSGGILNLFTPPWGEAQDEVWASMVAGWEAEPFTDEETRQAAFRALEHQWNTTPHPFWAGLTPAQVLVGGGPRATIRELLLAAFKLEELHRFCQDRPRLSPIIDRFGPSHGLDDMVDEVIDYCQTRLLFDELLTGVRQVNPRGRCATQKSETHPSLSW